MNITIDSVKTSELIALRTIGMQTFLESFSSKNKASDMAFYLKDKFSIEQLSTELKNPKSQFFFLKDGTRIIGYLKVNTGEAQTEKSLNNALEIERIYLQSNYQRKGLGKRLFEKAIDIAKQEKIETVWLGVWEENLKAIKFYKKNGFIEFDRHTFLLGEDVQLDIMMKFDLD